MPLLLDIESRSLADLGKVGGRRYWEHPSTELLCLVHHDTVTGREGVWLPGDPQPESADGTHGAHNLTNFDRHGLRRYGWRFDYARGVDTSELARRAGLPGKLDALAKRWLGLKKDTEGSRYTKSLSQLSRAKATKGQWRAPDMSRVIDYCASDVEVLVQGWPLLEPWLEVDAEVSRVDRIVNERGVGFDSDLARILLEADRLNGERVCADVARRLGRGWTAEHVRAAAMSPKQFCEVTGAPNAKAETVARVRHPLARAREALASIARGKLRAGLARVSADGRLRDMHRYYGAHTGRWSGSGFQLQNMPRPLDEFKNLDIDDIADAAEFGDDFDPDQVDLLLRACLRAKPGHVLIVADFSSVEARVLAWSAGDVAALDVFRGDGKTYERMAARIIGCDPEDIANPSVERQLGKVAELMLGFGAGHKKFYENNAALLDAAGVNAKHVVNMWRALHSPIVDHWHTLEAGYLDAVNGHPSGPLGEGGSEFLPSSQRGDRDIALILPSGRPIVYTDARAYRNERGRIECDYLSGRGFRQHVYGGLLAENETQATARDLLAEGLVDAEAAGLNPVFHVHDEIVCEVPERNAKEALDLLVRSMVRKRKWARGAPIGATAHAARRYSK